MKGAAKDKYSHGKHRRCQNARSSGPKSKDDSVCKVAEITIPSVRPKVSRTSGDVWRIEHVSHFQYKCQLSESEDKVACVLTRLAYQSAPPGSK
jgi:hypothetical protein